HPAGQVDLVAVDPAVRADAGAADQWEAAAQRRVDAAEEDVLAALVVDERPADERVAAGVAEDRRETAAPLQPEEVAFAAVAAVTAEPGAGAQAVAGTAIELHLLATEQHARVGLAEGSGADVGG